MLNPIEISPITGQVRIIELKGFESHKSDLIVWWYGAIKKNIYDLSVPLVVFYFRELKADNTLGMIISYPITLTYVGQLRIGTVWRQGRCIGKMKLQE